MMIEQKCIDAETAEWIYRNGYFKDDCEITGNFEDGDSDGLLVEIVYGNIQSGPELVMVPMSITYLDVWVWLYEKKNVLMDFAPIMGVKKIHFRHCGYTDEDGWHSYGIFSHSEFNSPQDAIIAGINYLKDNYEILK